MVGTEAAQHDDLHYFKNSEIPLNTSYKKSGDTALHIAARCGHATLVEHLLLSGADVECVQILLQFGAQVDSLKGADSVIGECKPRDHGNETPLMLACTKDSIEVIQELVKSGANVSLKNKDGWTPFHIACREGHLGIVHLLYDHNNTVMNTASKNGRTPLHTAALHGCHSVVTFLLSVGPFTEDTTDSSGSTPLMDAIKSDHVEVAQTLISTQKGDLCREDNAGLGPLHLAAQGGCLKSVKFLVESLKVDVNSRSSKGFTPLFVEAKEGQLGVISYLVSAGADVNVTDTKGRTALHIAAGGQQSETCRYLLENGAIIRADNSSLTPGMMASAVCFRKYDPRP
ncbi:ankyrin repeat domain-containing protein 16-like [Magallana gigas]|uniref:ankyrin repeat domain-containing protein 16-like n=1 Tax=Magallana gigas TaxID=29159 RepID=UPI0033416AD2